MSSRFNEKDFRPTGRISQGVAGIDLDDSDEVVSMQNTDQGDYMLIVSEKGLGKMTRMQEFSGQKRAGKGLKCYRIVPKSGKVIGALAVTDADEILMINSGGIIIRMGCADISITGRITTGVKLMNLKDDEKVACLAKVVESVGEERNSTFDSDGDEDQTENSDEFDEENSEDPDENM